MEAMIVQGVLQGAVLTMKLLSWIKSAWGRNRLFRLFTFLASFAVVFLANIQVASASCRFDGETGDYIYFPDWELLASMAIGWLLMTKVFEEWAEENQALAWVLFIAFIFGFTFFIAPSAYERC